MSLKRYNFLFFLLGVVTLANAQINFTNKKQLLSSINHFSGVAISIMDMNGDGLDDIVRMNQGNDLSIEYQSAPNQPFEHKAIGQVSNESQWGMCTADVNNDGFGDVLTGGSYDGIKVAKSNASGDQYTISTLIAPGTFVQGVNFADVNNDGWVDAFVCHDDGVAIILGNNGDGTFTHQPNWIDLTTSPVSDNSGNYGSVWSDVDNDGDVDLYIAKCRQGVSSSTDPRRINQLFLNNGDGTYTQDIADVSGLRIGAQSWTADFGDIDNDGDFDCFITNHDVSSQVLINDGVGHFTDITMSAGMFNAVSGTPIQGVFADFDNDGFVDIIVAGSQHQMFRNNHDNTFSESVDPFSGNEQMESFALGDFNHDGYMDVYGGYAEIYTTPTNIPDALWINNGSGNNYIGFNLSGIASNQSGIGAKITVYSALGVQVREVRSGQSYGISNSLAAHFGLDSLNTVDSVIVNWPSGTKDVIYAPTINQYIGVQEGGCIIESVLITASANTTFCTGQSVDLIAPEGFMYAWNTGDTIAQITVGAAGSYRVTLTDVNGCSVISNSIITTVDPIEIPTLTAASDTVFCDGGSVLLTATPAASYLWSNGATTQSIVVQVEGYYTVSAQGLCATFQSAPVQVSILASELPVPTGDTVAVGSTATLLTSGSLPIWYENPGDPVIAGEGNFIIIPNITATDTFWVSNKTIYDSPNQNTGMMDHMGGQTSDNNYIGSLIFDCFTPFTLASVKVYTTKAGTRKIDLKDKNGVILQSKMVNILVGTSVIDLDFEVPAGTDMQLMTDPDVNQANINSAGPQLRRSNQGVEFPYVIPNIVSVKSSSFGLDRYYYFFNWEIDLKGYECESALVPVIITVDSTLIKTQEPAWANQIKLFPNPTTGNISVYLPHTKHEFVQIGLLNSQNALISKEIISGSTLWNKDLGHLPKGVYWMEIYISDTVIRRKVVVQ